ncbi:MAG: hypothetical protein IJB96_12725 [Lachnospira sp.]|nr:hypothetical protein [Lachnospira sp.]
MRLNIGKMLLLAVVASVVIAGCGNREPEKSVGQLQQEGTSEMTGETKTQSVAQETEATTVETIKETVEETQTIKETETITKEQVMVEIASETQAPTEAVTEKPTETQFSLKDFVLNNRLYSKNRYGIGWFIYDFKEGNIAVQGYKTKYVDYMEEMTMRYRVEGNTLTLIPQTVIPAGSTETVEEPKGTTYEYVPSEKAFKAEISEIYLPTGELQEYTAWLYTSIPETE